MITIIILTNLYFFLWFLFGTYEKDYSFFDCAWGGSFILGMLLAAFQNHHMSCSSWILLFMITAWSIRLTWHLNSRHMIKGKDPRYTEMESRWHPYPTMHAFFKIFLLQANLAWIIALPTSLYLIHVESTKLTWIQSTGITIALLGLILESVADSQLWKHKKSVDSHDPCRVGLWNYSRHPNYVGETLFWWGLYIFCALHVAWWSAIAPLLIYVLVRYVSGVPVLEKRWQDNPRYASYLKTVPIFWPFINIF